MTIQYNVNLIGNLTNTNGVLSNFSASNYATLKTPFSPISNDWEVCIKFTTGESYTADKYYYLFSSILDNWYGISIVLKNNFPEIEVSNDNSEIISGYTSTLSTALNTSTNYYLKLSFNGSVYTLSLSDNGSSFTSIGTLTSSLRPYSPLQTTYLGHTLMSDSSTEWFNGEIDLNKSYIKIDNNYFWRGVTNITTIQLRHDTAANWTSINPILLEGEVGIETDTRKQKFGDGTTAWNSLSYSNGDMKQNILTAGSNIQINGNTISATNTTYSAMTVSEGTTGTATTARTMRADGLKSIIQGTKLTGLSTADNSAVVATDSILTGIGKLQAEINNTISADTVEYLLSDKEDAFETQSPLEMTYTLNGDGGLDASITLNPDGTTTTGNAEEYYGFYKDNFGTSLPQTDYWRFNFRIKRVSVSVSGQPFFALDDTTDNFVELYFSDYNFPTDTWVQCAVIHQAGASTVQFEYTVNGTTTTVQNILASGYTLASNKYVNWMGIGITVIADLSWNTNYQLEPYGVRHVFTDRYLGVNNTAFDGQWVNNAQDIIPSAVSLNGNTDLPYTVTLPNDGHVYEVMIVGDANTGTTIGNWFVVCISSNVLSNWAFVCGTATQGSRSAGSQGTVIIPMKYGTNNLTLRRNSNYNGTARLQVAAYRRLGTNT